MSKPNSPGRPPLSQSQSVRPSRAIQNEDRSAQLVSTPARAPEGLTVGAIVSERLQNQFGNRDILDALSGGEALGELAAPVVAELGWATAQSGPLEGSFSSNSAMLREMRKAQGGPPAMIEIPMSDGQKLPEEQLARFNAAFGYNFSHVVIHADAAAGRAAAAFHARAFTIGSHIWMGEGEYQPGSPATNELLAHELTHVIQSDKGRIPANVEGVSSPSDPLEQEAYAAEAPITAALRGVDARVRAGGLESILGPRPGSSEQTEGAAVGMPEAPREGAAPGEHDPDKKGIHGAESSENGPSESPAASLESAPHLSAQAEGKRDAQSYYAEGCGSHPEPRASLLAYCSRSRGYLSSCYLVYWACA